jgi:hypothetical protein
MRTIRLYAITPKGVEALDCINQKNDSFKNRVKIRLAQKLNKSLYKRFGMDYEENFDDINHVYTITFSSDVGSSLNIAKEKLIKLMFDNGASISDYVIEVF